MTERFNLIGGEWLPALAGGKSWTLNPATGALVSLVPDSHGGDMANAIAAAHAAFQTWRKVPAPQRGALLLRTAQILGERKQALAELLTREMGKVLAEAEGDVQEAIDICNYMAGEGRRMHGFTAHSELPDKHCMALREPIGVIGAVTAFNFPVAVPSWKIAPALVAGNTVILKPAPAVAGVSAEFIRAFHDAGFPPGVVNLVLGGGEPVVRPLIDDPRVAGISFTGSTAVGLYIAERAGRQNKRLVLEMGGKNAIIVMDDADLDLAAEGIIWSAFGTSGQRCTSCSRLIVHRGVAEPLLERLAAKVAELTVGDGLTPGVTVGPLISGAQVERVDRCVQEALAGGARLVAGGRPLREGELARGHFYAPTILADVTPEQPVAVTEIFGPVLAVLAVDSLDEALAVSNSTQYGLSASIFTRNINDAYRAIRELNTGIVYVNAGTTGAEVHLPFGGTRNTGNGRREVSDAAFEFCTEWKSVYIDFSGRLQRAQIDVSVG